MNIISLSPSVTLRYIRDDRFKQGVLTLQFLRPMCRQEAAKNALLPSVLLRGCQSAPDLRRITQRLDDLYGASVGPLLRRTGDVQSVGFSCGFMDDRFALSGDEILAPLVSFLLELLLEPLTEGEGFLPAYVDSEKKNLISAMEARRNDKRGYAIEQMLRLLCREDTYGIPRLGDIPDVQAITAQELYSHYKNILSTSPIHLFYVGSAPEERVVQLLKPLVEQLSTRPVPIPAQTGLRRVPFVQREEALDIAQGKLCMGYVTPVTVRTEDFSAMQVLNALLGAGMISKLFMQVREKLSLCYDIGSSYYGSKGIMTVAAGIEFEKKDVVQTQVEHQLQLCRQGSITAEELEGAKQGILSSLRVTHDSPGAMENYYATAAISGLGMTPETYMEKVRQVTVEDCARVAGLLELGCVYFLKGVQ